MNKFRRCLAYHEDDPRWTICLAEATSQTSLCGYEFIRWGPNWIASKPVCQVCREIALKSLAKGRTL